MLTPYAGVSIPEPNAPTVKRRYSVTQDIVGFRRCARQYGALHVRKYAPAHQTQLYFGTILHQVLDRCHMHYHGLLDPGEQGRIPDDGALLSDSAVNAYFDDLREAQKNKQPSPDPPSSIVRYFVEVEDSLKSQGIRAITRDLRLKAIRVLQYFNRLEGPELYPRVRDTEHRLQADRTTHILHGVVDLLLDGSDGDGEDLCEIWDYKGTRRVGMCDSDLETYLFQMRVYAHLYELKHGVLPQRVVLYFLSELDGPTCPTKRPANAILALDEQTGLSRQEINRAIEAFSDTVGRIEEARATNDWTPSEPGKISVQDCAICDLRWDCVTAGDGAGVAPRYP